MQYFLTKQKLIHHHNSTCPPPPHSTSILPELCQVQIDPPGVKGNRWSRKLYAGCTSCHKTNSFKAFKGRT